VVVVLILLMRVVGKRFFGVAGARRDTRAVQVMSRSSYSPRHEIVTLRVGRRLLVLADGGGQVNKLTEITDPDEVAAFVGQLQEEHGERARGTFGNLFGKHRGQYEESDDAAADDDETYEARDGVSRRDRGASRPPGGKGARRGRRRRRPRGRLGASGVERADG
jgi:flagellar biogenesis protein FliO